MRLWENWHKELLRQSLGDPDSPAFPAIDQDVVTGRAGLDALSLTRIVQRLAEEARLTGRYSFTSLRIGFVRSAVRAGTSEPSVLDQAGLRTMKGLMRHSHRERLLSHSVAGLVGL